MSALDLIRLLRRTLASLREADDPRDVNRIARALAHELEARLDESSPWKPGVRSASQPWMAASTPGQRVRAKVGVGVSA